MEACARRRQADDAQRHLMQVTLNTLCADPTLVPDGEFGQRSRTALKAFQAAHDLPADGQITPQTLAALDAPAA